ncbi:MAG: hypothetical protein JOS17DRAFT_368129 [Linnemannia elongata]|nr:MAG: hypothetical protein JOS17DRAFT_368129 [Linnemannia elongata]
MKKVVKYVYVCGVRSVLLVCCRCFETGNSHPPWAFVFLESRFGYHIRVKEQQTGSGFSSTYTMNTRTTIILSCLIPNNNMTFFLFFVRYARRRSMFLSSNFSFALLISGYRPHLCQPFVIMTCIPRFLMLGIHFPLRGGLTLDRCFFSPFH